MWFENNKPIIALAPMADYTDSPFCRIIREIETKTYLDKPKGSLHSRELGRDDKPCKQIVIFREMVSSEAIVRENAKTLKMCEFSEMERPIVLQVFGSNPETMSKAVNIIHEKFKPDGIDINMGCPVPKITKKNEAGASLMKNQDRAVEIVNKIKQDNPEVVLSVKTRLGWSNKTDILEFALKLEKAGAQLLTIHGRTKEQGYSGDADWGIIKKVKEKLSIPVIANGDIKNREDIERCLKITGADGVMIGRGALGNPWALTQFSIYNSQFSILTDTVLRHAKYHLEHYGPNSMRTFRKHLLMYFKAGRLGTEIKDIKKIRAQLVVVNNLEELKQLLSNV